MQKFNGKLNDLMKNKTEDKERYLTRQLERQIWQFRANQNMPDSDQRFLQGLSEDDPIQFEELANKKKWTSVNKNP